MTYRRKGLPNEAAAVAQYHAINVALGLPRLPAIQVGLRAPLNADPAVDPRGWSLETAQLTDGPGPTVYVVLPDEATSLHGQTHDVPGLGPVTIALSGHVNHDPNDAAYTPRRPVLPPGLQ